MSDVLDSLKRQMYEWKAQRNAIPAAFGMTPDDIDWLSVKLGPGEVSGFERFKIFGIEIKPNPFLPKGAAAVLDDEGKVIHVFRLYAEGSA